MGFSAETVPGTVGEIDGINTISHALSVATPLIQFNCAEVVVTLVT